MVGGGIGSLGLHLLVVLVGDALGHDLISRGLRLLAQRREHKPVAYITGPDYLMAAPPRGGEIEKLDKARLHQELVVFARTLERIEAMSKAEIRG